MLPSSIGHRPSRAVFVSLMKRWPRRKQLMLAGVVGSTVLAVVTRMVLMADAGYPGSEGDKGSDRFAGAAALPPQPPQPRLLAGAVAPSPPQLGTARPGGDPGGSTPVAAEQMR